MRSLARPAFLRGRLQENIAGRGGSQVQERLRRATGRPTSVGDEPAAGRSLRGNGAMVDQRHDVICRLAVAGAARPGMAAARLTLTEASPVCVTARIERWSLPRAPDVPMRRRRLPMRRRAEEAGPQPWFAGPGRAGAPAPLRVRGGALRPGCSWPSPRSSPCPFRPRRRPS